MTADSGLALSCCFSSLFFCLSNLSHLLLSFILFPLSPHHLFLPLLPLCHSVFAANKKPQPLDAVVLHLLPAYRQLLRAQYVRGCGGGELSQVSPAAGGGGGTAEGGEETKTLGEKKEK